MNEFPRFPVTMGSLEDISGFQTVNHKISLSLYHTMPSNGDLIEFVVQVWEIRKDLQKEMVLN